MYRLVCNSMYASLFGIEPPLSRQSLLLQQRCSRISPIITSTPFIQALAEAGYCTARIINNCDTPVAHHLAFNLASQR